MPPHIFHALSDDPARWERQFGCMAVLFHFLHYQPRFFRKHTSTASSAALGLSHFPSQCVNNPGDFVKASHQMETAHVDHAKPSVKNSRTSDQTADRQRPQATHKGTRISDFSSEYPHQAMAPCSEKVACKQYSKQESPNILDSFKSSNYTIREPPRKSFNGTHPPDYQSYGSTPARIDCSSSLPGSPGIMGFSHKACDGRSQFIGAKSLCDKPRGSLDQDDKQSGASHGQKSHTAEHNKNKACKDPLEELKESLRALAKLQETTQQFLEGFEGQKHANKPVKRTSGSSLMWWNARKNKRSNYRHDHSKSTNSVSFIECPALVERTSSFDYTEAVRISKKLEETPARLSLDGRELVPKAVLKLREAMRLGIVSTDEATCSSGYEQKKRIQSTSLRSALLNSKEEIKGLSKNNSTESVAAHTSQRSNIIARLMGLYDLPPRPVELQDGSSTEFKRPGKSQPGNLLKDVVNNTWRWNNKFDTYATRHGAEYGSRTKHGCDCSTILGALEETRTLNDIAGASDSIKKGTRVHEDERAKAMHKNPRLLHYSRANDHCTVNNERRLPIGSPSASSGLLNLDSLGDNIEPAANIPKHAKLGVMPNHFLKTRAAGLDRSGRTSTGILDCAEHSHYAEKKSEIILQDRFKEKQEHVKGSQDAEFEMARPQVKSFSSSLDVEQLHQNRTVGIDMQLKGSTLHSQIQENLEYDFVPKGEIPDKTFANFHQRKHASTRHNQYTVKQSHDLPQFESKLLERSKPQCRMKTLSMVETQLPFDVPTAEDEETSQVSITCTPVTDGPKLQVIAAAKADKKTPSARRGFSCSATTRRQRGNSNHCKSDKRSLVVHDKKGPGTKHFQPDSKVQRHDQTSTKLANQRPASPSATCTQMSVLGNEKGPGLHKHGQHQPAETAKAARRTAANNLMHLINPEADFEKYTIKSRSNQKTRSLDSTGKLAGLCAEESARGKSVPRTTPLKQRKIDRNGDEWHKDFGGRTDESAGWAAGALNSSGSLTNTETGGSCAPYCRDRAIMQQSCQHVYLSKDTDRLHMRQLTIANLPLPSDLASGSKSPNRMDFAATVRPYSSLQLSSRGADYQEGDGQKFEYVDRMLESAGLWSDVGEEEVERRLGAWVTSESAGAATFWEMERSYSSMSKAAGSSRHQRRLIFDCVNSCQLTDDVGCKRGLQQLAVWKELAQSAPPLHSFSATSANERLRDVMMDETLQRSWTYNSPPSHVLSSLEDAIFQDLLLEFII